MLAAVHTRYADSVLNVSALCGHAYLKCCNIFHNILQLAYGIHANFVLSEIM